MKRKIWRKIFVYLILIIFALIQAFPFYFTLVHSLQAKGFIPSTTKIYLLPEKWDFNNYAKAWERTKLGTGFLNSMIVSVSSTAISAFIAMFVGYILAKKRFKGRVAIFFAFIATMMVPSEVLLIPLFNICRFLNIANTLYALIYPGIISVFGIFIAKQFMETIPDSYLESAHIDGAGELRIFLQIVMPMAKSALATFCIIQFTAVWNEYLWPMVIINDPSKFTIQLSLARLVDYAGAPGLVEGEYNAILKDAAVISTILPVVIVFLVFQKKFVEGIALSGIKG